MKLYLRKAILLSLTALSVQVASADPVDAAAARKVQQIRDDVTAKQKQIAEENRVAAPQQATPVQPLDLPLDTTDSPGATND